jgi:hypothetical protein
MTKRQAKCADGRGYAHHWDIDLQDGNRYLWGSCRHCPGRRLFRVSWPDATNWKDERDKRMREERKLRRRERNNA